MKANKQQLENLGRMLREARIRKGLLQKDVAKMIKLYRITYNKYEKGNYFTPSQEKLKKIAKVLDLDIAELLANINTIDDDLIALINNNPKKNYEHIKKALDFHTLSCYKGYNNKH